MKNKKLQKWVVKGFDNNHNHSIISPKSVAYLCCHKKKLSIATKSLVKKFGEEGLPTRKVVMIFNVGDQTFTSRNCWNPRDVRGKKLDARGASTVLNYCQKQVENSNFFYAIQCDDVGHMIKYFLGGCMIKNGLSILWGCSNI